MGSLSTALATGQTGFRPAENGLVAEDIIVTGASASAGDTGTWTSFMKQPQYVTGGPLSYSISGQVVTLMDEAGLGNAKTGATVFGYP